MKAFVIKNPNDAGIYDVPKPEPKSNEVLIKVYASGFCGTDIHTYLGEHPTDFPVIPGHEFSGVIESVGKDIKNFAVGDKVIADPNIFCENCVYCKQNMQIHCENIKVIGNTRNGAFAEYVTAPEGSVFYAKNIDLLYGSMAEPLGCVINAHNKVSVPLGAKVLVFGAGTIGLMHLLVSKIRGASEVVVVDIKEKQLKLAKELGASRVYMSNEESFEDIKKNYPLGFEVVIDATGVPTVVQNAITFLAKAGAFIAFGACPTKSEIKINPFDLYYNDWKLIGSYALEKTLGQSINLIEQNAINLEKLVGEVITIDEMPEKFKAFVEGKTSNKIIVKFG